MTSGDLVLLGLAVVLVLVAAALAGIEAALSRTSRFRAEKLERDGRARADRLVRVARDAARYVNLLLLLRVAAELGA
ncbi:MAG: CNNM domain-containing protein, partial [Frankia sp.]|nr:CNNM domain-containing protein [Frankia sp.]